MDADLVEAMVGVLEAKDFSTAAHTWRVILYTRAMAEAADLDPDRVRRLTFAAALHDVGKVDIPDAIILKPGPLTHDEFEVMKTHAAAGHARLLAMEETDEIVLTLVRHHHERWDGLGYPDGLAGEAIPPGPRYFAVIDSFDAMTSVRPYRHDVGPEAGRRAIDELLAGSGTRYCPDAVDRFVRLYRRGDLDWIMEHFNDRCAVPDYRELVTLDRFRA